MKKLLLILLLVPMCAFAASAIYPDPTEFSFGDIIKWAQPRIASGTALPSVASAAEGDIFVDISVAASPTINILSSGSWRTISGGAGGGDTSGLQPIASMSEYASAAINIGDLTATYTLTLADAGRYLRMNTASTTTSLVQSVLIPPIASVAWTIGQQITVVRSGVGEVAIGGYPGVTINSTASPSSSPWIAVQYGAVTIVHLGTSTWECVGFVKDAL